MNDVVPVGPPSHKHRVRRRLAAAVALLVALILWIRPCTRQAEPPPSAAKPAAIAIDATEVARRPRADIAPDPLPSPPASVIPAVSENLIEFEVRDLAHGGLVADLDIGGGSAHTKTDALGRARLQLSVGQTPDSAGKPHKVAGWTTPDRRVLWVYRVIRVGVTPALAPGCTTSASEMATVRLTAAWDFEHYPKRSVMPWMEAPWTLNWLQSVGLRNIALERNQRWSIGEERVIELPCIRGGLVRFNDSSRYLRGSHAHVQTSEGQPLPAVTVYVRPFEFITGNITRPADMPADRSIRITLDVHRRCSLGEMDMALWISEGSGISAGTIAGHPEECDVTRGGTAQPDANGRYRIPLQQYGSAVMIVRAIGYPPVRRELGELRGGLADVNFEILSNDDVADFVLVNGGVPLAGCRLTIAESVGASAYLDVGTFDVDAEGKVHAGWLRPGDRYYWIIFKPQLRETDRAEIGWRGFATWNRQRTIDVASDLVSK